MRTSIERGARHAGTVGSWIAAALLIPAVALTIWWAVAAGRSAVPANRVAMFLAPLPAGLGAVNRVTTVSLLSCVLALGVSAWSRPRTKGASRALAGGVAGLAVLLGLWQFFTLM